jgi:hypothetical protein
VTRGEDIVRGPLLATPRGRRPRAAGALIGVALLLPAPHVSLAQGVTVALLPATQTVAPGSEFVLSLEVTRAGSPFNAFDAIIGYDPAALTLLPQTPVALQEGAYFAAACPNHFHRFQAGVDRDTITDVLLCAGKSVTGPGQIYRLRFRASNTAQSTHVRFLPGLQFYNAGLFANPDSSSDAIVGIGVPATAESTVVKAPAPKPGVKARPARRRASPRPPRAP